jgi:predicted RNA binding protein YcfA (HicA-like mRNA interferase family)
MAKRIVTWPRKIRELVRDPKKSGWYLDRQKGSHRVFKHPKLQEHVSLSGADGEDAKNYEEKNVGRAIENARKTK